MAPPAWGWVDLVGVGQDGSVFDPGSRSGVGLDGESGVGSISRGVSSKAVLLEVLEECLR